MEIHKGHGDSDINEYRNQTREILQSFSQQSFAKADP